VEKCAVELGEHINSQTASCTLQNGLWIVFCGGNANTIVKSGGISKYVVNPHQQQSYTDGEFCESCISGVQNPQRNSDSLVHKEKRPCLVNEQIYIMLWREAFIINATHSAPIYMPPICRRTEIEQHEMTTGGANNAGNKFQQH